jgi:hypothetical protein
MRVKHEWVLWMLVVLALLLLGFLSWMRWGRAIRAAAPLPPEERLAIYVGELNQSERFSELRVDRLGHEFYCEPEPILTADHFARCLRQDQGDTFALQLELTEEGKRLLTARVEQHDTSLFVIVLNGRALRHQGLIIDESLQERPLPNFRLHARAVGYVEPSRQRMEELEVEVQAALNPAGA